MKLERHHDRKQQHYSADPEHAGRYRPEIRVSNRQPTAVAELIIDKSETKHRCARVIQKTHDERNIFTWNGGSPGCSPA